MINQARLLALDVTKSYPLQASNLSSAMPSDSYLNSPHSMLENSSSYSILMNLLGIDMNDIGIRVNVDKREVAVLAKKESKNLKRGFFWVFGVPVEGLLTALSSRYRDGVLEIIIPKLPQDPIGIVH